MQLIKSNVASINHKDKEGVRVELSIARGDDGLYFIVTDSGEDTMHRFDTVPEAISGIASQWGAAAWGLQFTTEQAEQLLGGSINLEKPVQDFLGWVLGLDQAKFTAVLEQAGHHASSYQAAKYIIFQQDKLAFVWNWTPAFLDAWKNKK